MSEFFYASLATFGLATLISGYDGPYDIFVRLRNKLTVARCCVCLSVWIAVPIAIVCGLSFIGYASIIGVVILLDRAL